MAIYWRAIGRTPTARVVESLAPIGQIWVGSRQPIRVRFTAGALFDLDADLLAGDTSS